jgi:hypothetical protein
VGSTTAQGIDSFSFRQGTKLEFDRGREKRRGCARPVHTCAGVVVEGCCLVGGVNAGTWAAALMQSLGRRRAPADPRAGRRRSCRDLGSGALLQALGPGRRRSSGRQSTPAGAREGWRRCSGGSPLLQAPGQGGGAPSICTGARRRLCNVWH